ncbi:glycosyltransferase family 4 protein [Iningainema tapete]|uniref:Glycosyltransferase family 4 protein n=1 Tax=Iningainema tapete BLCC-T55 TaxID=2748662 RepID=A0A8J7C795_9CYAN|nr:glycosyltransferase family 4 protein [Iningainema tapete]MBD2775379.1 glycosyltransferase family 4 protein [Iningainema tapete BLCC-T55]
MENISQIETTIRGNTASPEILVISRNFLPKAGGIEEYIYNRCMQDPEKVIALVASCRGDKAFDKMQPFPVYRWLIPKYRFGLMGILQPLFNIVCPFVLAIKLYFRYHYRYIEWGHGYDFISLLLLSYILPIRFFIYIHGNDIANALRNPILHSLLELTFRRSLGIVCHNSFIRDYLTTHFQFNTPTHVIYPAIRKEKFGNALSPSYLESLRQRVRSAYHIPDTAVVILSVGRLIKRQGFDQIIENLTPLLTLGLDVHYILCGQGPLELELKSLASRLRVGRRVHFAGYIPDTELASYYAACDMFAMLTVPDPTASLDMLFAYKEAGYFGKPVIASRLASLIDTVRHEDNGILVNPFSGCEVLQAFRRLCQDQKLRERLGCRGKAKASHKILYRSLYVHNAYSCILT